MPANNANPRRRDDHSLIQGCNAFTLWIVRLSARWTPTCSRMTRLISDEMERPLPWLARLKMRAHYVVCCYCEDYKRDLRHLRFALRHAHEHVGELSDARLAPEVKQKIKEVLRAGIVSDGKAGPV